MTKMTKIKAMLLAAGYGTRLKPITNSKPKCLVEVGGETMLTHWLNKLSAIGCTEVLINTHYLAEKVDKYISGCNFGGLEVNTCYEKTLLGTAGTLLANKNFLDGEINLLIHVDNYTRLDLFDLIDAHINRPKEAILTMLTFETSSPQSCGIVKTDNRGIVNEYFEKENGENGNTANGAVFVFGRELVEHISKNYATATDFCADIIPKLTGKIYTYGTKEFYLDIGTLEALQKAETFDQKWRSPIQ